MNEEIYQKGRERAMRVLVGRGYPRALAEDAIQAAALFFVEHQRGAVTVSLFVQYAIRRANSLRESAYGSTRRPAWSVAVGSSAELAEFEGESRGMYRQEDES